MFSSSSTGNLSGSSTANFCRTATRGVPPGIVLDVPLRILAGVPPAISLEVATRSSLAVPPLTLLEILL